jgi:hypothetical protein
MRRRPRSRLRPDEWQQTLASDRAMLAVRLCDITRAPRPIPCAILARDGGAGRPLVPGADAEWIDRARQSLRSARVRALACLTSGALANTEWPLAAQFARMQIEIEPFRETGWQQLIRAPGGLRK